MGGNQQLFIWKMSVDFPKSSRLSLFKFRFPCAVESCKETAAMFHFFRKSPESKKPSVPDTEADGFVLLGLLVGFSVILLCSQSWVPPGYLVLRVFPGFLGPTTVQGNCSPQKK
ncbi:uncharacterized protein LOC610321 isoform X5 [Canis lupus familiaris]|uniref:uncharacterized protein LOC610321 isoform X5 n=1 Tax=Canis lupus familiaris TaxID=9615 RepID=UPI000BAA0556|nr:uncharacterized protein LOC610321 isoform X5 [Canis lupus familiaris]XP_038412847.1 uncharacterized protein LOC610321 isoform X5 [Canis lupus familiaris]XP_038542475.1 uncharacterized protein LOC610321 isoform X5 [Canis lupus familiaris]|eukprot:XP_022283101.1 uncharacterized protein LOC610321 isoform X4 [Canis lupus familiaris]